MIVEDRRAALRLLTYGCAVVTAVEPPAGGVGATITWLSQCSFEPPLLMAALRRDSRLALATATAGAFAVNILDHGQREVAKAFFKVPEMREGRLAGHRVTPGAATGAPLLAGVPAWLECRVTDWVDRGDHRVVVAAIVAAGAPNPDALPLELRPTGWSYGG